jgi:hypothetical protein
MKTNLLHKYIVLVLFGVSLLANDDDSYLTLEKVIELAKKSHFEQKEIVEDINFEEIKLKKLTNSFYPEIYFEGQFGREKNLEKVENDTLGYIVWKNKLYDSNDGLTQESFKNNKKRKEFLLTLSQNERKITVMKTFFDTNLASLYHQYLIEQLAMDAIYHNRAKDFYPTGRVSDVELLEKETNMLIASAKNFDAEENIYNNKSKLANLLEIDVKKLPELKRPKLKSYFEKELPSNDRLLELAIKNDINLQQLQTQLEYLNGRVSSLKNSFDIQLGSVVMYGNEPQKTLQDENNRWEARLTLKVPLYDKENNLNEIQKVQIEKNKVQIGIDKYKLALSQKIDEIVSKLGFLKRLDKGYKTQFEYRNLYLEKSRVNYELDRQSDLGDAMVQLSRAEYELEKNSYEFVITYEILNLIVGETI